jgi:hypothetical protein
MGYVYNNNQQNTSKPEERSIEGISVSPPPTTTPRK